MAKFQTPATPDTQSDLALRSHDRDDDQKTIDAKVKPLVDAWEKAGKPAPAKLTDGMTDRLQVQKADRSDVVRMVRRAFTLYKADPAWYAPTDPDADGWVIIKFGPQTRKPTTKKKNAPATPAATPAPPADAPPADEGKRGGVFAGRR